MAPRRRPLPEPAFKERRTVLKRWYERRENIGALLIDIILVVLYLLKE